MNEFQKKAWDCLTQKEQQSLFLQLSENKSSWEAGEILKLSHLSILKSEKGLRSSLGFSRIFLRKGLRYLDQIAPVKGIFKII